MVTGAASGIGLAMTRALVADGASVVMTDIEAPALSAAAMEFGDRVSTAVLDVTDPVAVDEVAARNPVDLVFANAGVTASGAIWESTLHDWEWMWRVNVMGLAHCVRSFVPRLIAQGTPGHVVITASLAGYMNQSGFGAYNASKHAAAAIAETLAADLKTAGHPIGVTCIAPWFVTTRLAQSARNRPASLGDAAKPGGFMDRIWGQMAHVRAMSQTADEVAAIVIDAVKAGSFGVFPYEPSKDGVRNRFEHILNGTVADLYIP